MIVVLATLVAGCSWFGEKPDITKDWSAARLYAAAKERLENEDYEQAIDYYEKLEARYPFGPQSQQAQLDLVYAYYKNDQPAAAVAAADRFIKLHPRHPNVDYAYYMKGLANYVKTGGLVSRIVKKDYSKRDTGAAMDAFRDFSELTRRFPNSKYATDAAQRMLFLKNTLAMHEVHVARYYMERGAYVAAANRARFVVENYQRTPAMPDALVILAKSYKAMHMADLSEDAVRVLELNYP
ncbi:MAG: outer membrane protein assembly factor BamD, partial [Gammaproteobacteria bacterium]|nr:outer membrane protein assembly factor BamD [Gemmatimonadota bacterium]NIU75411.1 outer membrane protein assembly factor BamD [Gammaproteobacteria bacterium]